MRFTSFSFKQSITSFPQCPGAHESPPLELTTFSAWINVTLFSINGHQVDKGPRIWVESTHSSMDRKHPFVKTTHRSRFFSFISPFLSIGGFSAGVSPAGQSNRLLSGIFAPNRISSKALISRIATAAHSHHLCPHLYFKGRNVRNGSSAGP